MPYTTLVYLSRKPGMTPDAFAQYYTHSHLQLIRQLSGPAFPRLHTQHYIKRHSSSIPAAKSAIDASGYASTMSSDTDTASNENANTARNANTPAVVLLGSQAEFDYDCVATLQYDSEDAFKAFYETIQKPENWSRIIEDEENFLDRSQTRVVVLGDVVELRPLAQ
ncbi:EthD domain-containing protein [Poronia punctata]|nr:EthD domain-containing protein [Poronia punctata]